MWAPMWESGDQDLMSQGTGQETTAQEWMGGDYRASALDGFKVCEAWGEGGCPHHKPDVQSHCVLASDAPLQPRVFSGGSW